MIDYLHKTQFMHVSTFCFCRDALGRKGMATSYKDGMLTVLFMDSTERQIAPKDLDFSTWKSSPAEIALDYDA